MEWAAGCTKPYRSREPNQSPESESFPGFFIDSHREFRYDYGTMKTSESMKKPQEWFKQAAYDMKTAQAMLDTKRYIYSVFMCHLSIEKALKGLYTQILGEVPPKTHNLVYLVEKIKLELPEEHYDFLYMLNGLSVPTRYPDDLQKLLKDHNKTKTGKVIDQGRETLKWLKARL